jgi:hypothetical protein
VVVVVVAPGSETPTFACPEAEVEVEVEVEVVVVELAGVVS